MKKSSSGKSLGVPKKKLNARQTRFQAQNIYQSERGTLLIDNCIDKKSHCKSRAFFILQKVPTKNRLAQNKERIKNKV